MNRCRLLLAEARRHPLYQVCALVGVAPEARLRRATARGAEHGPAGRRRPPGPVRGGRVPMYGYACLTGEAGWGLDGESNGDAVFTVRFAAGSAHLSHQFHGWICTLVAGPGGPSPSVLTCVDHEGDLLANPTAPEPRPFILWTGRALLHWARLLQRTVASRDRRQAVVARRNAAMRAAYDRGIDRETIARTIGLSPARVGQALRGEHTPE